MTHSLVLHTQNDMKHIAVFASGNGTNAENIIRYFQSADNGAEVSLVVCNRPNAHVLQRAERLGVPSCVISRDMLRDQETIMSLMRRYEIDFIVLAGFLLMIPPFLVGQYSRRMLNIHPSLLPKFGGKGMYGDNVHKAVVAAGEAETGITIHFVSEQYDEGDILFQASTPVETTDTPEDVARKIHELEQIHFPRVIAGALLSC